MLQPKSANTFALFAWLIGRTFSANEQYFSLITNQPTVLSAMAYQPNEQGTGWEEARGQVVAAPT